jgi:hypothetical protein
MRQPTPTSLNTSCKCTWCVCMRRALSLTLSAQARGVLKHAPPFTREQVVHTHANIRAHLLAMCVCSCVGTFDSRAPSSRR